MQVKVSYSNLVVDLGVDTQIREAMESINKCRWIDQNYNHKTRTRTIEFDIPKSYMQVSTSASDQT